MHSRSQGQSRASWRLKSRRPSSLHTGLPWLQLMTAHLSAQWLLLRTLAKHLPMRSEILRQVGANQKS